MKRGRRTRLTPQLQRKICKLLERGHTVGTACGALGLPDRSFHRYCARNATFLAETQRARAKGRVRIVDSILNDRDWRGKAWYLERTAPDEFGRVAERELPAVQGPKPINVAFVLPSGEQINMAKVRAIAALPPLQTGEQYHEESTRFDGNHATEPNGEQPLS
jgi:hypothetical protein